jgi:hypothetical protein
MDLSCGSLSPVTGRLASKKVDRISLKGYIITFSTLIKLKILDGYAGYYKNENRSYVVVTG